MMKIISVAYRAGLWPLFWVIQRMRHVEQGLLTILQHMCSSGFFMYCWFLELCVCFCWFVFLFINYIFRD